MLAVKEILGVKFRDTETLLAKSRQRQHKKKYANVFSHSAVICANVQLFLHLK